jgi:hypothetical protein
MANGSAKNLVMPTTRHLDVPRHATLANPRPRAPNLLRRPPVATDHPLDLPSNSMIVRTRYAANAMSSRQHLQTKFKTQ